MSETLGFMDYVEANGHEGVRIPRSAKSMVHAVHSDAKFIGIDGDTDHVMCYLFDSHPDDDIFDQDRNAFVPFDEGNNLHQTIYQMRVIDQRTLRKAA